jgi:hypothetical protein
MAAMRRIYEPKMEPEFARRLFSWLESRDGQIGCGGGWRNVQPERPGFAPPGMSFHQDQWYFDGTVWYAAVDLVARNPGNVHRAPRYDECPQQGSPQARTWGVHINTSEAWHIQPVELDGYATWVKAGRPRPRAGYQIPGSSAPVPPTMGDDDDVEKYLVRDADGFPWVTDFASYATGLTEDQGGRGRDMRGYITGPDNNPWPLDRQDTDLMHRLAEK